MTLETSIAKLNIGELVISQFPKIAMKALNIGIDSQSLVIPFKFEIATYILAKKNNFIVSTHPKHQVLVRSLFRLQRRNFCE